uniref:Uncharacterized protein n=1 Tax=Syphacia muris TaxID=451379 RepID=A0A158R4A5_9BILA
MHETVRELIGNIRNTIKHYKNAIADNFLFESEYFCWANLAYRIANTFGSIITIFFIQRARLMTILFIASIFKLTNALMISLCNDLRLIVLLYWLSGMINGITKSAIVITFLCIQRKLSPHIIHVLQLFQSLGTIIGLFTMGIEPISSKLALEHQPFLGCYKSDILIGSQFNIQLSFVVVALTQVFIICYSYYYCNSIIKSENAQPSVTQDTQPPTSYGVASCIFVFDELLLYGTVICGFFIPALGMNLFLHVQRVSGFQVAKIYLVCCGSSLGSLLYPLLITKIFVKLGSRSFVALNFIAIIWLVLLFVSIMDIQMEFESNPGRNNSVKTLVWSFLSGQSAHPYRSRFRSRVQRLSKRLEKIRSGALSPHNLSRLRNSIREAGRRSTFRSTKSKSLDAKFVELYEVSSSKEKPCLDTASNDAVNESQNL